MRPRALALLLTITAADYGLWHWSVAAGHDVLSLAAGLTLPPLGTVAIGALGLSVVRLAGSALRRPSAKNPAGRAHPLRVRRRPPGAEPQESQASSERLAA